MKNTFRQQVLAWCIVMIGVLLAYSGYLILGVLMPTLGICVATVETDETLFGDEEEPNEEGES